MIASGLSQGLNALNLLLTNHWTNQPTTKGQDMNDTVKSESNERTANNAVRHTYRVLTDNEKIDIVAIKDIGADFLNHIDTVASHGSDSRELALARTKVEEAVMWAVKHITK